MTRQHVIILQVTYLVGLPTWLHGFGIYGNMTGNVVTQRDQDLCSTEPQSRTDCHPEPGASQSNCEARGCCWRRPPNNDPVVRWCFYSSGATGPRCHLTGEHRSDCHPGTGASEAACLSRGCCWQTTSVKGAPYCFHPTGEDYSVQKVMNNGKSVLLSRNRHTHWPHDVMDLQADVVAQTGSRLQIKIYDPNNKRYEVPLPLNKVSGSSQHTDYTYNIDHNPFGLTVTRKSTKSVLFDASLAPLIFSDQMLQISVGLPTTNLYGIGENRKPFRIPLEQSPGYSLWAHDIIPKINTNLYGSHPFVLGIEPNGDAFGIFLLNSNALRIDLLPTSPVTIRYRALGGILDFYVFTGPTPDDVIDQYWALIGQPPLPPYWSLGYHLSRWDYGGSSGMNATLQRMRNKNMPFDAIWNDIDYMVKEMDWTYDIKMYGQLPDIVKDVHSHGEKYVIILDPGISNTQPRGKYAPYDDGVTDDIFVKTADGSALVVGEVWPGKTVFPDFTHPNTEAWWQKHAQIMHAKLPFDGLWIDMNEPSNFKDGSETGCGSNTLENPPYTPPLDGGSITAKTLCMSAKFHEGLHYNLHNLYGYFESRVTYSVLKNILQKRPFILSRSTFVGSGNYVAHWEGDNFADWSDLYYSIPEVLSFNMFGIPFIGVDICGFRGDSDEELCTRWLQLGAFYPFMRSHNTHMSPDKDPAATRFSSTAHDRNREALRLRYRLLPFLYSLMSKKSAVARPIIFQYPTDSAAYNIDKQFLWGDALLISPVLNRGHTTVNAYFPQDTWYDFFTGAEVSKTGRWTVVSAPLDKINVHIRGGTIVPTQVPDVNTEKSRRNDFGLVVASSSRNTAQGFLYWDDGETLDAPYNQIQFNLDGERLTSTIKSSNYATTMTLGSVDVYGVATAPTTVRVNGVGVAHTYDTASKVLHATRLKVDLLKPLVMTW
ncbi:lysosomal alpha-glucosidase-like [Haliotis rufescens]|uniref:lysosomal alpha-glucosidase-like n=1 Tax=Haliotis rufescens TaxID=6454 RepID=UPI00201ED97A|nr:lysosomal alpha-glucosidase-like [Haliotis rufescens]